MPRYLVTEQMYVDADNEDQAIIKTARPAGEHIHLKDRTAERVTPELEVGMPVRLVRNNGRCPVHVPLRSEGVVTEKRSSGKVCVVFHARHRLRGYMSPWTQQIVAPADLEVVEGWSS